jgi:hypothetical protein
MSSLEENLAGPIIESAVEFINNMAPPIPDGVDRDMVHCGC